MGLGFSGSGSGSIGSSGWGWRYGDGLVLVGLGRVRPKGGPRDYPRRFLILPASGTWGYPRRFGSSRQWYLGLPPAVCGQTAGGKLSPVRDSACHITTGGPSYFPPALCDLSLAVLAQTAGGKFRPADHNLPPANKTTNSRR